MWKKAKWILKWLTIVIGGVIIYLKVLPMFGGEPLDSIKSRRKKKRESLNEEIKKIREDTKNDLARKPAGDNLVNEVNDLLDE